MKSIIIPVYNEEKNVRALHQKIMKAVDAEVIFVDDGSTDNTYNELLKLKPVKVIRFRRNFGQTAAMSAGITHAKGDIIITMDGDLQNDPADIPRLLEKLKDYDAVSGWRFDRRDKFSKRVFSRIANKLRSKLIRDPIHDSGCSLKAFKRECFDDMDLYGEIHRYIPAMLTWKGFSVGEVKVKHHSRKNGKTKYDWKRIVKGFVDLLNVWFWRKYSTRPLHLFGSFGILMMLFGGVLGLYSVVKWFMGQDLSNNFAATASLLFFLIGVNFFVTGLMADIAVKNYYNSQGKETYAIKEVKDIK